MVREVILQRVVDEKMRRFVKEEAEKRVPTGGREAFKEDILEDLE